MRGVGYCLSVCHGIGTSRPDKAAKYFVAPFLESLEAATAPSEANLLGTKDSPPPPVTVERSQQSIA